MANFQLGDTEQVSYAITALDGDSNPAAANPQDIVTVTSSAPASVSVVPDAVPVAGTVASGQLLGGATLAFGVVMTATVSLAAGGPTLTNTGLIDVVGGTATSLAFSLGVPTAQGTLVVPVVGPPVVGGPPAAAPAARRA